MAAPGRVQGFRILTLALPLLAVAAVWYFLDVASFRSADEVARAVRALGDRPFGFAFVPLGFALGTLLFLPVTALIVGTTLAFDPWPGFVYAMTGGLIGAALAYGVGRALGSWVVDGFSGPRLNKFTGQLRANPFRSSLILHLLPFGSFTVVNLLAGSLRVSFGRFLLGTAVGLLPGIVFFTFLSGQFPQAILSASPLKWGLIAVAVLAMAGVGWLLRRWARARERGGTER